MDVAEIARIVLPLPPDQRALLLNQQQGGLDALLGVTFSHVADDEVVATLTVDQRHLQPYGLCHGGVYATLAETLCSVGAAFAVMATGHRSVGAENSTRFLRSTRAGAVLTAVARPVEADARGQLWETRISDEAGVLVAVGRVRTRTLSAQTS